MNKIMHPIEPEELMAYLDGELSSDRAAVAAAHLSECAECREVVSELRGVSQTLKSWNVGWAEMQVPQAISAALADFQSERRVAGTKQGTGKANWRRWPSLAWAGGFVAVSLLAILSMPTLYHRKTVQFSERMVNGSDREVRSEPAPASAPAPADIVGGLRAEKGQSYPLSPPPPPPPSSKGIARGGTDVPTVKGPMIIRTAQLSLITKDFDNARSAMETILKRHRGYVGDLRVGGATGSGRTLSATLRVPADQLDASLMELKALGRVESESQSGQDVTSQYVDLQARLANARNTEQRLTDLLRQRTGKLSDVLEVEQEVDRVRGEIEQMEAERKTMSNQVSFATLNATITEDYKAQLQVVPPSTSTRLSNAAVDGYKGMVEGIVGLALFLLENGPTLLLWVAILFFPARLVWKKMRRSFAH